MVCEPGTCLNLWRQHLGTVPDSVWEKIELECLILAENGLQESPIGSGRLTRLQTLDLGHNKLSRIPESIGELIDLAGFLYLHDNSLSSLPRRSRA